jgi:hypothetical protein
MKRNVEQIAPRRCRPDQLHQMAFFCCLNVSISATKSS